MICISERFIKALFISEKKVLPCAVFLLGVIYSFVSANFYFE